MVSLGLRSQGPQVELEAQPYCLEPGMGWKDFGTLPRRLVGEWKSQGCNASLVLVWT